MFFRASSYRGHLRRGLGSANDHHGWLSFVESFLRLVRLAKVSHQCHTMNGPSNQTISSNLCLIIQSFGVSKEPLLFLFILACWSSARAARDSFETSNFLGHNSLILRHSLWFFSSCQRAQHVALLNTFTSTVQNSQINLWTFIKSICFNCFSFASTSGRSKQQYKPSRVGPATEPRRVTRW